MTEIDRLKDMTKVQQALEKAVNDVMRDNYKYHIVLHPVRNLSGHVDRYEVVLTHTITVDAGSSF